MATPRVTRSGRVMLEELLQATAAQVLDTYAAVGRLAFTHVPHETDDPLRAKRQQGQGVRKGWPDLDIVLPRGRTLYIELKTPSGALSPEQKLKHEQLRRLGHRVETLVADSDWDLAIKLRRLVDSALAEAEAAP